MKPNFIKKRNAKKKLTKSANQPKVATEQTPVEQDILKSLEEIKKGSPAIVFCEMPGKGLTMHIQKLGIYPALGILETHLRILYGTVKEGK